MSTTPPIEPLVTDSEISSLGKRNFPHPEDNEARSYWREGVHEIRTIYEAERAELIRQRDEAVKRVERIVAICAPHVNTPDGKMVYSGPDLPERFSMLSNEVIAALPSPPNR